MGMRRIFKDPQIPNQTNNLQRLEMKTIYAYMLTCKIYCSAAFFKNKYFICKLIITSILYKKVT